MTGRSNTDLSAIRRVAAAACVALLACLTPLHAAEPKVPAAPAPDGIAVALLGPGVDYRAPLLRERLARDGEGDLISWDFADGDNRPFEAATARRGTSTALALLAANPAATLVIVREKPNDPQAFGHMMSFVAKTPARIVVWLDAEPARPDWPILIEAAQRFKEHVFLVPRVKGARPAPFAALAAAANVVVVDIAQPSGQSAPSASRLMAAAGKAAQKLAADATRPVAGLAADIRNEIAATAQNPWAPAVVPGRPR